MLFVYNILVVVVWNHSKMTNKASDEATCSLLDENVQENSLINFHPCTTRHLHWAWRHITQGVMKHGMAVVTILMCL